MPWVKAQKAKEYYSITSPTLRAAGILKQTWVVIRLINVMIVI